MRIAHLTASPFFGGPERQMLGLAENLPADVTSVFLSFPERGLCAPFVAELRRRGLIAEALHNNTPRFLAAIAEVQDRLRFHRIDLLCCHGYKADLLGWRAARRQGIPVVSVSRGWTAATWKVRIYEAIDRFCLRYFDRVVCVSAGQAQKVLHAGAAPERVRAIRNAICIDRFGEPDAPGRAFLQSFFPEPRRLIVGAAGRLSPEKGFDILIEAAAQALRTHPDAGFLLFGDGALELELRRALARLGLADRFVLGGFRDDLDRWLPNFDAFVLPSYTEGLPNVVLEAFAARVPVVATAVGGTPEVVEDGATGFLVPAGHPEPLAQRIVQLLDDEKLRQTMAAGGFYRVRDHFTFAAHARQYMSLFRELLGTTEVTGQDAALRVGQAGNNIESETTGERP